MYSTCFHIETDVSRKAYVHISGIHIASNFFFFFFGGPFFGRNKKIKK